MKGTLIYAVISHWASSVTNIVCVDVNEGILWQLATKFNMLIDQDAEVSLILQTQYFHHTFVIMHVLQFQAQF